MTENKFRFSIPTSNNGVINIPLKEGNALFVLGANGVGKSTLMHNLYSQNANNVKRILAHRQAWFSTNTIDMTSRDKTQNEQDMKHTDRDISSRWNDNYSYVRSRISIFDLINSQNIRARHIADAVDNSDFTLAKSLSNAQAPIQSINELFSLSNIPITIRLDKDDKLFASKNGGSEYSIAELSDGERNALLICTDILTAEPNCLIILDEPERHLHRSIISPLLSSLFQKRKDCVFVISTHDIYLPIDHSEASTLLIRSCQWNGKNIKDWDADLISETDEIPDSVRREILGSKRDILFVEGEAVSLDRQIYQLIFPDVTVIPVGSCTQVEKSVEGIKGTESLHWVNAYGLIDADDRTPEQIQSLLEKGVVALDCYSVESLYYNPEIIKKIAKRCADVTGVDEKTLYEKATSEIIKNILPHKERLCSKLCEKQLRVKVFSLLPNNKEIAQRTDFNVNINVNEVLETEEKLFDKLIEEKNITGLINRYPIRETPVLGGIVSGLGLDKERYESAVRKLIIDDKETLKFYRVLLNKLSTLIIKQ